MGKGALFMKAKGVRLHGANDLRLEEFELPEITEDGAHPLPHVPHFQVP